MFKKDFNWLLGQLEQCGIDTKNPIFKDGKTIIVFMSTEEKYNIAINFTLSDAWIYACTYKLIEVTHQDNLLKLLKYCDKLRCARLVCAPYDTNESNNSTFLDLAFDYLTDVYDRKHLFVMIDSLFQSVDRIIKLGLHEGLIKVEKDSSTPRDVIKFLK